MIDFRTISFEEVGQGIVREEELEGISNEKLRREKIMTLALVRGYLGREVTIGHRTDGSPFVAEEPELFLSLSHSGNRAAAAFSKTAPVGIDIQEPSQKLFRVAERFLRPEEIDFWSRSADNLLRAWTIKEAVYKAAGIKELLSGEIFLFRGQKYAEVKHCKETIRYNLEFPEPGITVCIRNK